MTGADLLFSCQTFPAFSALPLPLSLPPSVCLRDPLADLILLRDINIVQIDPIQQSILHDLTHNLLFHLLRIHFRSAEQ